jgi:hypothetical protein
VFPCCVPAHVELNINQKAPALLPQCPPIPAPSKQRHNLRTLHIEVDRPSWRRVEQRTACNPWGISVALTQQHTSRLSLGRRVGDAATDTKPSWPIPVRGTWRSIDRLVDLLGRLFVNDLIDAFGSVDRSIEAPE